MKRLLCLKHTIGDGLSIHLLSKHLPGSYCVPADPKLGGEDTDVKEAGTDPAVWSSQTGGVTDSKQVVKGEEWSQRRRTRSHGK